MEWTKQQPTVNALVLAKMGFKLRAADRDTDVATDLPIRRGVAR
jgi:hypothetical protein